MGINGKSHGFSQWESLGQWEYHVFFTFNPSITSATEKHGNIINRNGHDWAWLSSKNSKNSNVINVNQQTENHAETRGYIVKKHDGQLPCYFPSKTSPCNAGLLNLHQATRNILDHRPAHLSAAQKCFALNVGWANNAKYLQIQTAEQLFATLGTPFVVATAISTHSLMERHASVARQIGHDSCYFMLVPAKKSGYFTMFYPIILWRV